ARSPGGLLFPGTHELDLVPQLDAETRGDRLPDMIAKHPNVCCQGAAVGDDEICVQRADLRAPDAKSLEPGCLDKAAGMVAGRVAEDASRVLIRERLRRAALRLVLVHAPHDLLAIAGAQPKRRGQDHLSGVLESGLAVGERARL